MATIDDAGVHVCSWSGASFWFGFTFAVLGVFEGVNVRLAIVLNGCGGGSHRHVCWQRPTANKVVTWALVVYVLVVMVHLLHFYCSCKHRAAPEMKQCRPLLSFIFNRGQVCFVPTIP